MKRKLKLNGRRRKEVRGEKKFTTIEEVTAHFFPKGSPVSDATKGRERGTEAAEHAFTEISRQSGSDSLDS
jgi:hypothetical protein